jgi:ketosteroid isomerase-like protein
MILRAFFDACSAFDSAALYRLLHPEARISELPNLMNRDGTERDRAAALAAFERGRGLLAAQSFELHSAVADGDTIAARSTWRGRIAATGQELTAHIASFTEVRGGLIYRHATYDCYEPFQAVDDAL